MSAEEIGLKITRSPEFKLIYTNGAFGGLSPLEGRIIFYVDRLVPKVDENSPGQMKTDYVERELQAEIHMSPQIFVSLYNWMQNHIQQMEKEGVLVKKEEPKV